MDRDHGLLGTDLGLDAAHVAARTYWSQSRELMLLIVSHNIMILLWAYRFSTDHVRTPFILTTLHFPGLADSAGAISPPAFQA